MDTPTQPQQPRLGPIGTVIAGREVVAFFALTLAVSWAVWAPGAVGAVNYGSLTLVVIVVGGFGPLVAAAVVTWLIGGSLRAWARQVLRWRVRPRWYLAAIGIPLVMYAATSLVYLALGNSIESSEISQQAPISALPLIFALNMVFVFLLVGKRNSAGVGSRCRDYSTDSTR